MEVWKTSVGAAGARYLNLHLSVSVKVFRRPEVISAACLSGTILTSF
jgi:hypothetical protein